MKIHIRYEGGPHDGEHEEIEERDLKAVRRFAPPMLPPDLMVGLPDPAAMIPDPDQYYFAGSDPKNKTGYLYKYYDAKAH